MKKIFLCLTLALVSLLNYSCSKDDDDTNDPVCTISGGYTGTFSNPSGSGIFTYFFKENHFIEGSVKPSDPLVTFGSYDNTCETVTITTKHLTNGDYYRFDGKLSTDKLTITGTYKNVTKPAETGPFTLTKIN